MFVENQLPSIKQAGSDFKHIRRPPNFQEVFYRLSHKPQHSLHTWEWSNDEWGLLQSGHHCHKHPHQRHRHPSRQTSPSKTTDPLKIAIVQIRHVSLDPYLALKTIRKGLTEQFRIDTLRRYYIWVCSIITSLKEQIRLYVDDANKNRTLALIIKLHHHFRHQT